MGHFQLTNVPTFGPGLRVNNNVIFFLDVLILIVLIFNYSIFLVGHFREIKIYLLNIIYIKQQFNTHVSPPLKLAHSSLSPLN